jgi:hypothetical protein
LETITQSLEEEKRTLRDELEGMRCEAEIYRRMAVRGEEKNKGRADVASLGRMGGNFVES